eukprot:EG_transcript_36475
MSEADTPAPAAPELTAAQPDSESEHAAPEPAGQKRTLADIKDGPAAPEADGADRSAKRLKGEHIAFQRAGPLLPPPEAESSGAAFTIRLPAAAAAAVPADWPLLSDALRQQWDSAPKLDRKGLGYDSMESFIPQTHDWTGIEPGAFPVQQCPRGIQDGRGP